MTPRCTEALPPLPVEAPLPIAVPVQVAATGIKRKRIKRKRRPGVVVEAVPVQTPIHAVLGLLKEKNTLAAAFLLREILAPPVSRR